MNPTSVPPVAEQRNEFTTLRIFIDDSRDIMRLAALRGLSIAEAYRQFCGPVVKNALRDAVEETRVELGESGA